ncbi:response regulator transcription factor [Dinghuibacter silviterrae]|uniref:DNA-binding response OmpR family regulator n=1 Tax=Dinghuibacter silviterrae TaxID=1539049 RepID=A0A4R8DFL4_9BACT|nr:response regulator transcription factor [Dinghuibacter silviterrae]TDW96227.1 DNA-binding response OmpR family regulator [Dinghuibacter silviterrae]
MRILIVEDEVELCRSIVTYLKRENYVCDTADKVSTGLDMIDAFDYDCIILDISLPDGTGFRILKELKINHRTDGVIVISAKDSLDDRVTGLNLGADDYLPKPFHLSELNARISALIRRRWFQGNKFITVNELTIDLIGKMVIVEDKTVELTRKEFDLLLYLVSNKNRVVSKNALAENIWGEGGELFDNFDFLYSHMKNLKKKLAQAGCRDYIKSVYGLGYKFVD